VKWFRACCPKEVSKERVGCLAFVRLMTLARKLPFLQKGLSRLQNRPSRWEKEITVRLALFPEVPRPTANGRERCCPGTVEKKGQMPIGEGLAQPPLLGVQKVWGRVERGVGQTKRSKV